LAANLLTYLGGDAAGGSFAAPQPLRYLVGR
jgi:hypothetical protein